MTHANQKLTDVQELKVVKLYQTGLTLQETAKLFDVGFTTIANILKRHGVSRRSNKINSRRYFYDTSFFKQIDREYES